MFHYTVALYKTGGQMSTQPNIILILSDQHNRAMMGCAGDEIVRTPNLDRLAENGVALTMPIALPLSALPAVPLFSQDCTSLQPAVMAMIQHCDLIARPLYILSQ